jgi:Immunity protein 53
MNVWSDVQNWFASNCDGEWEHDFGIKIETMSDPGWLVVVDLDDTNLEGREFTPVAEQTSESSWIDCRVEQAKYRGMGDPSRVEEILRIFVDWAKSQNEDWLTPPRPMTEDEYQKHEDEQFYLSLGDEVENENCRHEDCTRNRIRQSVMCREHHFEMIKKRAPPESAS